MVHSLSYFSHTSLVASASILISHKLMHSLGIVVVYCSHRPRLLHPYFHNSLFIDICSIQTKKKLLKR